MLVLGLVTLLAAGDTGIAQPRSGYTDDADVRDTPRRRTPRPRTRITVTPDQARGRLLYRDCTAWLEKEFRPSGTVIVPRERCWWVRG